MLLLGLLKALLEMPSSEVVSTHLIESTVTVKVLFVRLLGPCKAKSSFSTQPEQEQDIKSECSVLMLRDVCVCVYEYPFRHCGEGCF